MTKLTKRKHPPTKRQIWLEREIKSLQAQTRGFSRSYFMALAKLRYDQQKARG